ncbi:inositol monophosphatase family protein [Roseivirga sp. BDSF3-8]|uniref:inositol monophosphatase family protein n=1 Tax=Roseivirga sp. BDSF3-8 TaxID=3241598 RepID=UPI003531DEE9
MRKTDYLSLSRQLCRAVKNALVKDIRQYGLRGLRSDNPENTKATHAVDRIAYEELLSILEGVPGRVYMEGFTFPDVKNSEFTVFIDPVDGSANWDRGIGDPCFCLAITEKEGSLVFGDLSFAYVEGLRSGDRYYTAGNRSYFHHALTDRDTPLKTSPIEEMKNAMAYIKPGYSGAGPLFTRFLPHFFKVRDIRAIDNSGMEICELARGATDILVEARELSDFYNLLAFPILHKAGGVAKTLDGLNLADTVISTEGQYDYLATANESLMKEVMGLYHQFLQKGEHELGNGRFFLK